MILLAGLGAERREVVVGGHLRGAGCEGDAGSGQDVQAEVAAALSPFVVLLGQDGADQADQGVAAGEDPTTSVRRRISRFSRSWGLLDQICRHSSFGKAVKARTSGRAASR